MKLGNLKHIRQKYEYNISLGRKNIQTLFEEYLPKLSDNKSRDVVYNTFLKRVRRIKASHNIRNTTKCERIFLQTYNKLNNKLK